MDTKLKAYYNIISDLPKFTRSYTNHLLEKKKLSTATVQATEIRAFLTYLAVNEEVFRLKDLSITALEHVDEKMLDEYFLQVSPNSRIIKISYLNMFFMHLVKERQLSYNPLWDYEIPEGTPAGKIHVSPAEFKDTLVGIASGLSLSEKEASFAGRTQLRDIAIIALIYFAGLSLSECAAVNVEDITIGNDLGETLYAAVDLFKKNKVSNKAFMIQSWFLSPITPESELYNFLHQPGILIINEKEVALDLRLSAILLTYISDFEELHEGPLFYSLRGRRIAERSIEYMISKHFDRYADKHVTAYALSTSYQCEDIS